MHLNEMGFGPEEMGGIGPCNIHLDGASYHFHKVNRKPNKGSTMQAMKDWLASKGIAIPLREDGKMEKPVPRMI